MATTDYFDTTVLAKAMKAYPVVRQWFVTKFIYVWMRDQVQLSKWKSRTTYLCPLSRVARDEPHHVSSAKIRHQNWNGLNNFVPSYHGC